MLAQQGYQIQLRLVDANVGYPIGDPLGNGYDAVSNDPGLNAIFDTYGADAYYPGYGMVEIPIWEGRIHFVTCNSCDINALEQALDNYPSVIEHTVQNEIGYIANALYVELVDLSNGNNTGNTTPEGIIITNNSTLNSIFIDNTVLYFEQAFPSSQNPVLLKVFNLVCDCSAIDLQPILQAETDIIENTERLGYVILGVEDVQKIDFKIYPNPVEDTLMIDSSEKINSYEIIGMLGQSLFKGIYEENINSVVPSLKTGTYILKLVTDSGKTQMLRFVKK